MTSEAKSFRELEAELQIVLNRLEHGEYDDLEDMLRDHEAGMRIVTQLEEKLESAKATIKKVADKT